MDQSLLGNVNPHLLGPQIPRFRPGAGASPTVNVQHDVGLELEDGALCPDPGDVDGPATKPTPKPAWGGHSDVVRSGHRTHEQQHRWISLRTRKTQDADANRPGSFGTQQCKGTVGI